ncbi:CsxC family protein [Clostridium sp.]|uniref:CsxC family protein n=1 Tax=Clostridium sp. TaxID=1506 RepID=UPI003EEC0CF1
MEENQTIHPSVNCGDISSKTLPLSSGVNIIPVGINGPLVVKIPVVLAETEIQINVEAELKLKELFYEIKRIKKNVYLTQCTLLPRSGRIVDGVLVTGKLFISGYVRKNIEYATADCVGDKGISGRIYHTTIDTKFTAVTEVQYAIPPIVNAHGVQTEIDLLSGSTCHDRKDISMGKSLCELSFEENTIFTENPYCELESVRIFEADLNRDSIKHPTKLYNKIVEKMVIYVTIKILQLQQVNIPMADASAKECYLAELCNFDV